MSSIKIFESKKIRSVWNEQEEKWYFAVVDIVEILTETANSRRYWSDLKRKLTKEGYSQLYENIVQLKVESADGKKYGCGARIKKDGNYPIICTFTIPQVQIFY